MAEQHHECSSGDQSKIDCDSIKRLPGDKNSRTVKRHRRDEGLLRSPSHVQSTRSTSMRMLISFHGYLTRKQNPQTLHFLYEHIADIDLHQPSIFVGYANTHQHNHELSHVFIIFL